MRRFRRGYIGWGAGWFGRFVVGVGVLPALCVALCVGGAMFGVAGAVAASAAPGPAPTPGAPGLPDGRHYELVTPASKDGNEVETEYMSVVSADGNAILFIGNGAMGEAVSSLVGPFVSRRTASGWSTASAVSPQVGVFQGHEGTPTEIVPSSSFTKFLFSSQYQGRYTSSEPAGPLGSVSIFLSESPLREPLWLGEPKISEPIPAPGHVEYGYIIAGASPSLETVYFSAQGTLVAQDAARAPHVEDGTSFGAKETEPWGFYEWNDGSLNAAGVLPDGSVSAYGAMQAAFAGNLDFDRKSFVIENTQPAWGDNEVSEDGSTAFFVSPDPVASTATNSEKCAEAGAGFCTSEPPQLYVRETEPDGSKRTVLVSQSQLPGRAGQPAPHGAVSEANSEITPTENRSADGPYVHASADGSQAFFMSTDQLTVAAPSNAEPKEYDFNLNTEELTYLSSVDGPITAVAPNGSDLIFDDEKQTPSELKLWTAGPDGGSVTAIAQLPPQETKEEEESGFPPSAGLDNAHADESGSVFVFGSKAKIPGFNDGGGFWQVYRYSVAGDELTCISCAPQGQAPVGSAEASYSNLNAQNEFGGAHSTLDTRVLSGDGDRVFFDSPNALVPAASNGKRNVYEWEDGQVYLISSGTSHENDYIMGSSASGNDVFFTTSAGLVPGDTDGAYDVYDARIPHPGDVLAPEAVPCEGAVCQGPPSEPNLLGAPASATFSGLGNPTLPPAATPSIIKKTTTKAVKCKRGYVKKRNKCVKKAKAKKAKAKKAGHNGRAK